MGKRRRGFSLPPRTAIPPAWLQACREIKGAAASAAVSVLGEEAAPGEERAALHAPTCRGSLCSSGSLAQEGLCCAPSPPSLGCGSQS